MPHGRSRDGVVSSPPCGSYRRCLLAQRHAEGLGWHLVAPIGVVHQTGGGHVAPRQLKRLRASSSAGAAARSTRRRCARTGRARPPDTAVQMKVMSVVQLVGLVGLEDDREHVEGDGPAGVLSVVPERLAKPTSPMIPQQSSRHAPDPPRSPRAMSWGHAGSHSVLASWMTPDELVVVPFPLAWQPVRSRRPARRQRQHVAQPPHGVWSILATPRKPSRVFLGEEGRRLF